MKRILMILGVCAGISGSLWAEIRFDLGLDLLFNQSSRNIEDDQVLLNGNFAFVPELGLYAQFNIGPVHTGLGLRGFSYLIAYTSLWPSVYIEVNVSKVTFHAGVGGYVYGILDLFGGGVEIAGGGEVRTYSAAQVRLNKTLIPEVSVWFRFGRFSRIGGGWVTIISLEEGGQNLFGLDPRFYTALKWSFPSEGRRLNTEGKQRFF
ncbi:MAG: hypothetical protein LBD29_01575 [Treponema sp.]|jgi:hypothetical protein|nr:hypothetical protein [Treponema sp.]